MFTLLVGVALLQGAKRWIHRDNLRRMSGPNPELITPVVELIYDDDATLYAPTLTVVR